MNRIHREEKAETVSKITKVMLQADDMSIVRIFEPIAAGYVFTIISYDWAMQHHQLRSELYQRVRGIVPDAWRVTRFLREPEHHKICKIYRCGHAKFHKDLTGFDILFSRKKKILNTAKTIATLAGIIDPDEKESFITGAKAAIRKMLDQAYIAEANLQDRINMPELLLSQYESLGLVNDIFIELEIERTRCNIAIGQSARRKRERIKKTRELIYTDPTSPSALREDESWAMEEDPYK